MPTQPIPILVESQTMGNIKKIWEQMHSLTYKCILHFRLYINSPSSHWPFSLTVSTRWKTIGKSLGNLNFREVSPTQGSAKKRGLKNKSHSYRDTIHKQIKRINFVGSQERDSFPPSGDRSRGHIFSPSLKKIQPQDHIWHVEYHTKGSKLPKWTFIPIWPKGPN